MKAVLRYLALYPLLLPAGPEAAGFALRDQSHISKSAKLEIENLLYEAIFNSSALAAWQHGYPTTSSISLDSQTQECLDIYNSRNIEVLRMSGTRLRRCRFVSEEDVEQYFNTHRDEVAFKQAVMEQLAQCARSRSELRMLDCYVDVIMAGLSLVKNTDVFSYYFYNNNYSWRQKRCLQTELYGLVPKLYTESDRLLNCWQNIATMQMKPCDRKKSLSFNLQDIKLTDSRTDANSSISPLNGFNTLHKREFNAPKVIPSFGTSNNISVISSLNSFITVKSNETNASQDMVSRNNSAVPNSTNHFLVLPIESNANNTSSMMLTSFNSSHSNSHAIDTTLGPTLSQWNNFSSMTLSPAHLDSINSNSTIVFWSNSSIRNATDNSSVILDLAHNNSIDLNATISFSPVPLHLNSTNSNSTIQPGNNTIVKNFIGIETKSSSINPNATMLTPLPAYQYLTNSSSRDLHWLNNATHSNSSANLLIANLTWNDSLDSNKTYLYRAPPSHHNFNATSLKLLPWNSSTIHKMQDMELAIENVTANTSMISNSFDLRRPLLPRHNSTDTKTSIVTPNSQNVTNTNFNTTAYRNNPFIYKDSNFWLTMPFSRNLSEPNTNLPPLLNSSDRNFNNSHLLVGFISENNSNSSIDRNTTHFLMPHSAENHFINTTQSQLFGLGSTNCSTNLVLINPFQNNSLNNSATNVGVSSAPWNNSISFNATRPSLFKSSHPIAKQRFELWSTGALEQNISNSNITNEWLPTANKLTFINNPHSTFSPNSKLNSSKVTDIQQYDTNLLLAQSILNNDTNFILTSSNNDNITNHWLIHSDIDNISHNSSIVNTATTMVTHSFGEYESPAIQSSVIQTTESIPINQEKPSWWSSMWHKVTNYISKFT